jgi:adenine-specific DNA-methyltransferase
MKFVRYTCSEETTAYRSGLQVNHQTQERKPSLLSEIEQTRSKVSGNTEAKHKSQFGQFLTPASTARFMAELFTPTTDRACRLLDAGAGIGSLTCAFLERWFSGELAFEDVEINAFELDDLLHQEL